MPLLSGNTPGIIGSNIGELRNSGRPEKQAIAIAYSNARQGQKAKGHPNRHKNLGNFLHPSKKPAVPEEMV